MSSEITGRVALVTGATKGIGREIARQLVDNKFLVYVGARSVESGTAVARDLSVQGGRAKAILIDVTDKALVSAAAGRIEKEKGKLDVLVNNAGVLLDEQPPSGLTLDILRRTYETNVFGTFNATQAMIPLLRKSPSGRVITLTSGLSLSLYGNPSIGPRLPLLAAYASSKMALNALMVQLALELRNTSIKVNLADPGQVATDLSKHRGSRSVQEGASVALRLALLSDDAPTGVLFDENGMAAW